MNTGLRMNGISVSVQVYQLLIAGRASATSWDVLNERSSPKITLRNLSSLLSLLSQLLASNSLERPFPRGTAVCALECSLPVVAYLFESLTTTISGKINNGTN